MQSYFIYGQNTESEWCGYDKIWHVNKAFSNVIDLEYSNGINFLNSLNKVSSNNKIYQIPVVFHVIYNEQNENIADSIILSQLNILNNAFFNSDTLNVRNEFRKVKGNAKIKFILANIDPSGKPTQGINRYKTWKKTFNSGDSLLRDEQVKFTTKGGADAWNTDKYLNIWVCNLNSPKPDIAQLLGYAYPPLNAKYWDGFYRDKNLQGVVIYYKVVGLNNPQRLNGNNPGANTLVHEIGHYLGLRHIWGENRTCEKDDYLWDTPLSSNPSSWCDYNKNTCSKGELGDLPDMFENYMDYTTEKCLQMFTKQQVSLMQYNLTVNRNQLITFIQQDKPYYSWVESTKVQVFPNPAQNYIYLEKILIRDTSYSKVNCQIIDMIGNTVDSFDLELAVTKIEINKLSAGCYYIYIKYENEIEVIKFIKI